MGKDYYKTLGVDKGASQEEIKKAFRHKAHQFHPDKSGGDEAKFKEVNEAYQILGNPQKKAQYDQYGSTFEQAQAGGGFQGFDGFRDFSGYTNGFNVDMEDLGDIFGNIGDIFGFSNSRGRTRAKRGQDIQMIMTIEFREAIFGTKKEITLPKSIKCPACNGNGAEPGTKIETCKACNGSGQVTRIQRTIFGNMQTKTTCAECSGEGKTYATKCRTCRGSGVSRENVNLDIRIPAGIDNGETIRLSGQGEAGTKGAPSGDLYIKIQVKPDARFERDGADIKTKIGISFAQAALGDKIDIETVEGRVSLKIPAGTESGTVFKLRGKGIADLHTRGKGDHYVTANIKTPKNLSRKQKSQLKELNL